MSLRDLDLRVEYRSDGSNIIDGFYVPCLRESLTYSRAVGYFTSGSLALAAKGISVFLGNRGTMRLVACPQFEQEDIEAILKGYDARDNVVERVLLRQIKNDGDSYSFVEKSRLDCLAWLIAEERLEVKIAFRSIDAHSIDSGIYHEKIGIFTDNKGNAVAFTGSPNETKGGLVNNFESLDVFVSWDDPHLRVQMKRANFEKLWANATNNLVVIDFPSAAKRELLKFRSPHYPTSDPESLTYKISEPSNAYTANRRDRIDIPSTTNLRPYQRDAYKNWERNGYRGVLSMATGTGKTITALAALVSFYKERGEILSVIACPYKHLVDQWVREARSFGFTPIVAYEASATWEETVSTAIVDFKAKAKDNVLIITTHSTFSEQTMQNMFTSIRGNAVFIADEMHHLGGSYYRLKLPITFQYRLGLSATPDRWLDEEGTSVLQEYFGETVYEFPLERAISEGYLTEYYYHPILVELNESERQAYYNLTKQIAQLSAKGTESEEGLQLLLIKRANLLNNAEGKIDVLSNILSKIENVNHTLVYCTPDQLKPVVKLLGSVFNIRVSQFTYRESTKQRKELLDAFSSGELQALVAIKCLDEGVDVPSTKSAFLLASSGNPREFIQRRGRILRKSVGKKYSEIYDLITIASRTLDKGSITASSFSMERKILKKELLRFSEFATSARNGLAATEEIFHLAQAYNILDY